MVGRRVTWWTSQRSVDIFVLFRTGTPHQLQDVLQNLKSLISGDVLTLIVNRRSILRSVQVAMRSIDFSFFRPLEIVFSGEDALDEGGPRREFFRFTYVDLAILIFNLIVVSNRWSFFGVIILYCLYIVII